MQINGRLSSFLLVLTVCTLMPEIYAQANGTMPKKYTGTWTEHYKNGIIKTETSYKQGIKEGISIQWYDSGCPMSVHHYRDDKLHGHMIKWEKCGGIIAIGEYQDNHPWDGFFLVNPATANTIKATTVHRSNVSYYVIEYTNGKPFHSLSKEKLELKLNSKPAYKQILNRVDKKQ